nr:PREDICTED: uncharacterized protein LOC109037419 [Bemisia tabaci]
MDEGYETAAARGGKTREPPRTLPGLYSAGGGATAERSVYGAVPGAVLFIDLFLEHGSARCQQRGGRGFPRVRQSNMDSDADCSPLSDLCSSDEDSVLCVREAKSEFLQKLENVKPRSKYFGDYVRRLRKRLFGSRAVGSETPKYKKKKRGGLEEIFYNYSSEKTKSDDGSDDESLEGSDIGHGERNKKSDDRSESSGDIGVGIGNRGRHGERGVRSTECGNESSTGGRAAGAATAAAAAAGSGTDVRGNASVTRRRIDDESREEKSFGEKTSGAEETQSEDTSVGSNFTGADSICRRGASSPASCYRRTSRDDSAPDVLFGACRSPTEGSLEDNEGLGVENEESQEAREAATQVWMAGFGTINGKKTFLHDIYQNKFGRSGEELCVRLLAKLRAGTYIVASHGNHLHICHACDYFNSTCRCYVTKVIRSRFGKWVARSSTCTRNIGIERWRNIPIYLSSRSRHILKINHSGGDWVRNSQNRSVPLLRSGKRGQDELVEECADESFDTLQFSAGHRTANNQEDYRSEGQGDIRAGRDREESIAGIDIGQIGQRQRQHKGETILNMMMNSAVTPLARFFDSHLWLESTYKWTEASHRRICDLVLPMLLQWLHRQAEVSLEDFLAIPWRLYSYERWVLRPWTEASQRRTFDKTVDWRLCFLAAIYTLKCHGHRLEPLSFQTAQQLCDGILRHLYRYEIPLRGDVNGVSEAQILQYVAQVQPPPPPPPSYPPALQPSYYPGIPGWPHVGWARPGPLHAPLPPNMPAPLPANLRGSAELQKKDDVKEAVREEMRKFREEERKKAEKKDRERQEREKAERRERDRRDRRERQERKLKEDEERKAREKEERARKSKEEERRAEEEKKAQEERVKKLKEEEERKVEEERARKSKEEEDERKAQERERKEQEGGSKVKRRRKLSKEIPAGEGVFHFILHSSSQYHRRSPMISVN